MATHPDFNGLLSQPSGDFRFAFITGNGTQPFQTLLVLALVSHGSDPPGVDENSQVPLDGTLGTRLRIDDSGSPLRGPVRDTVDVSGGTTDIDHHGVPDRVGEELGGEKYRSRGRQDLVSGHFGQPLHPRCCGDVVIEDVVDDGSTRKTSTSGKTLSTHVSGWPASVKMSWIRLRTREFPA